jgi:hypothetical protein
LAADPAPLSHLWPLTCVLTVWRTHLGWVSFAIVLSLTWSGLWFAGWTYQAMQPVRSEISSVELLDVPARPVIQMLRVMIDSPHSGECTRLSQTMLFKSEHGKAIIYPLGSSISGDGLGLNWTSVTQHDFVLNLPVPPAIPDGNYKFLYRSVFVCSWLGGLIQRQLHFDSQPFAIRLGAP